MKKVLALVAAVGLSFVLMGCSHEAPAEETAPIVEEVVPAAEVVEIVLPEVEMPAEEAMMEEGMMMDGEMVMDEMMPEDATEVAEEIVETPAE